MKRLLAVIIILLALALVSCAQGPSLHPPPPTPKPTSSGGGGSKQIEMEKIIKALEEGKKQKPERFEYLKNLLYKEPFTTSEYAKYLPLVYYENNTTVTRNQKLDVKAYVINNNPIEIRRVLYVYLEVQEPGSEGFRQVNQMPQIIQTNEYIGTSNYSLRGWPDFSDLSYLKSVGEVRMRVKVSDGTQPWYSSDSNNAVDPPFYRELVLNVINRPPEIKNVSLGPDPAKYNDPVEYSAEVNDPDGDLVNLTLHVLDDQGRERRNVTQEVLAGGKVTFKASEYGFFAEGDAGKNFTYYYTYGDGINVTRTVVMQGPHIQPSPKIWVEIPRVIPEDENYYWWQRYTFSVDIRNQNHNEFDVAVSLYTDTPAHPWKRHETKTIKVTEKLQTVSFDLNPFDVADRNQSFSYRLRYSATDQKGNALIEGSSSRKINEKLVSNQITSLAMIGLSLMLIPLLALAGGIFMERRFKWGRERSERTRDDKVSSQAGGISMNHILKWVFKWGGK